MSPQVFQILLSLVDRPLHGYAIIQDVSARTNGEITLTASTLYDALARLVDQAWIAEVDAPADASGDSARDRRAAPGAGAGRSDSRRRYYTLTRAGKQAAEAEAARLQRVLATARAKKLIAR